MSEYELTPNQLRRMIAYHLVLHYMIEDSGQSSLVDTIETVKRRVSHWRANRPVDDQNVELLGLDPSKNELNPIALEHISTAISYLQWGNRAIARSVKHLVELTT